MKLLFIILAIVTCLQLASGCCCAMDLFIKVCAAKRRKRSMDTRMMEDYKEKYGHLIGLPELDLFYTFDTDNDGFINIKEARASLNVTLDAFNEVDTNRDGFIQPAEFDSSLE
eukprot:GFUD01139448.1.p1 GENE.GFUD01139448.1~~GFUD01139448.1.p1  ORF type:complete len:113 (+),score=34.19 GFUD01139448.1:57-395(+)